MKKKSVINPKFRKYILIIFVVLFAAALIFLLIKLTGKKSETENESHDTTAKTSVITDSSGKPVSTVGTETEDEVSGVTIVSIEEEENIDNEWAMFLVNNQNPLPPNYDDIITTDWIAENYKAYYMDSRAAPYVLDMIEAAKEDGIELYVVSAYRTIAYQEENLAGSVQDRVNSGMTYEEAYADALQSVALPGCSEHNAGLAADLMSVNNTNMNDSSFENTPEFAWLREHAAEYGFILRYPDGKQDITGIIYEPWHYRFVGVYYADKINESGLTMEEFFEKEGWLDENGKAIKMTGPVEAAEVSANPGEPVQIVTPDETTQTEVVIVV
ncbi:MAG: M15 family metallopeptidase [Ruminococcus sp.]|jgi:D-alanyl-D-alanine carboxypeptidase|nr:M15 family metallopeptidase [Ruminococcus sp.]